MLDPDEYGRRGNSRRIEGAVGLVCLRKGSFEAVGVDMTDASDVFGVELRRRRTAAGLSLAMLAKRVNYSKGYLGKIETGDRLPGVDLARRCDAVLGAGGQLSALISKASSESPALVVAPRSDDEMWVMYMAPDGSSWLVPTPRREVLAAGTASLLGLRLGTQGMSAPAEQGATVEAFRSMFGQIRRLGQTASPSVVLPTVVAQIHTLRGLANTASSPMRVELLRLTARYCEYAGWMAQEAGDDRGALWWTRTAVKMGTSAGDTELATYALIREALISLYHDDAGSTIGLAQRAQADHRASLRVRGLAAMREAQGHGLAGDYDQCRRALDRGMELLNDSEDNASAGPTIGSTAVGGARLIGLVEGWCMHDLGRPRDAVNILDEHMAVLPSTARRAYARFGARRALAYAAAGEIDHASVLTGQVLDAAGLVDSATVRQDLRRLAHTLARWRTQHTARDVYPRLTMALRTPIL